MYYCTHSYKYACTHTHTHARTHAHACTHTHTHTHACTPVPMEEFLDSAFTRLPTLRGIKYSDPDLMSFSRCVTAHGGKYQVLYGADEVSSLIHCSINTISVGLSVANLGCSVSGWYCSNWQVRSRLSTVQYGLYHCLCSTYNYAGKLYNRLFSAFKANNLEGARLEQRRSQAMIKLLFKYGKQLLLLTMCVCVHRY